MHKYAGNNRWGEGGGEYILSNHIPFIHNKLVFLIIVYTDLDPCISFPAFVPLIALRF